MHRSQFCGCLLVLCILPFCVSQTFDFEVFSLTTQGDSFSDGTNYIQWSNKLFWVATGGECGKELFVSDGTQSGTFLLRDINPGSSDSNPHNFVPMQDYLFFWASISGSVQVQHLWRTDGTIQGTSLVSRANPSPDPQETVFTVSNQMLFYKTAFGLYMYNISSNATSLFPGTSALNLNLIAPIGTSSALVTSISSSGTDWLIVNSDDLSISSICHVCNPINTWIQYSTVPVMVYSAPTASGDMEPFVISQTGVALLADICPGNCSSWPKEFAVNGASIYFVALPTGQYYYASFYRVDPPYNVATVLNNPNGRYIYDSNRLVFSGSHIFILSPSYPAYATYCQSKPGWCILEILSDGSISDFASYPPDYSSQSSHVTIGNFIYWSSGQHLLLYNANTGTSNIITTDITTSVNSNTTSFCPLFNIGGNLFFLAGFSSDSYGRQLRSLCPDGSNCEADVFISTTHSPTTQLAQTTQSPSTNALTTQPLTTQDLTTQELTTQTLTTQDLTTQAITTDRSSNTLSSSSNTGIFTTGGLSSNDRTTVTQISSTNQANLQQSTSGSSISTHSQSMTGATSGTSCGVCEHGVCLNGTCTCFNGWSGDSCQLSTITSGSSVETTKSSNMSVPLGAGIGGGLFLLIIVSVVVVLVLRRRRRHNHKDQASVELAPLSNKPSTLSPPQLSNSTNYIDIPSIQLNNTSSTPWQIEFEEIKLEQEIGEGAYGVVYRGLWRESPCAVKKLKSVDEKLLADFKYELGVMIALRPHNNVVCFYGAVWSPLCIVTEFCDDGSLSGYLEKNPHPDPSFLKRVVIGVSSGLLHLHSEGVVHRDIAARNILLKNGIAKVSDFGLSRIDGADAQNQTKSNIGPIKWMAPECLRNKVYSIKSDAWAFGVLLWEVLHPGELPYENLDAFNAGLEVLSGRIPDLPSQERAPTLHQIMKSCFNFSPDLRPTFKIICSSFETLAESEFASEVGGPISSQYVLFAHKSTSQDTNYSNH